MAYEWLLIGNFTELINKRDCNIGNPFLVGERSFNQNDIIPEKIKIQ